MGATPVAGVDEVGRGALAGPVVVAVVILPYGPHPYRDSKQVSASQREVWSDCIRREAVAWGIGLALPGEVDTLNVLGATHLAAIRALASLAIEPRGLVTDRLYLNLAVPVLAPARADRISLQVAAASILAKCYRDRLLKDLAQTYPAYGLDRNKGYGTRDHLKALHDHGPSDIHRRSFRPVRQDNLFSP